MSAAVGDLPLCVVQVVLDDADGHAEEAVDPAHPLGVAAGQVVVDGDDVDALAFERVQVGGQRRDERLAFAGLHLGDLAAVQHHAADELDVEVPHVQHAAAGLADDGERLGQQVVERLAVGDALRGTRRSCARSCSSRQRLDRRLERVDLRRRSGADRLQFAFVLGADDFGEEGIEHVQARAATQPLGYQTIVPRVGQETGSDGD